MDPSNIAHLVFSFFIPIGWMVILFPFAHLFAKNWSVLLFVVLLLSLFLIVEKESFDASYSVNDIVADVLGFFMGTVAVVHWFSRKAKSLSRINVREISIRAAMILLEKIERKSAAHYGKCARISKNEEASGLFARLSRDSMRRAQKMRFRSSGWGSSADSGAKATDLEASFQLNHIFEHEAPSLDSYKGAIQASIEVENKKQTVCRRLRQEFHEDWKIKEIEIVLKAIRERVDWLEKVFSAAKGSAESKHSA